MFPFKKKRHPRTIWRRPPSSRPPSSIQLLTAIPPPVSRSACPADFTWRSRAGRWCPWPASLSQRWAVCHLHGCLVLHRSGRPHFAYHRRMVVWVMSTFWLLSVTLLWTLCCVILPPPLPREDSVILGGWRCQKLGWQGQWDLSLGNNIPPKTLSEPLRMCVPWDRPSGL